MKNLNFKKFLLVILILVVSNSLFFTSFCSNEGRANRLFNLEYKSFFIGTIVRDNNDKFTIKIDRVFIGDNIKNIEVKKFYNYSYSRLIPQKVDHIVAVLNNDNTLDLTWIFKATSTNYKTLFLACDLDEENEDVKLFQKFINDGEYVLNLDQDNPNFKNKINKDTKIVSEKTDQEKLDDIDKKANQEFENKMKLIYSFLKRPRLLILSTVLFLTIFYCLRSRKNFRKEVEEDEKRFM